MYDGNSDKKKILILDDEAEITFLLTHTLRSHDFEVDSANTAGTAFNKLWSEEYHLFMSDIMMPGMDGIDVLRVVRSDTKLKDLPVIILSAKILTKDEVSAITGRLGALLVRKPFSPHRLVELVRKFIADREGTLKFGTHSGALELT
jgi:DNA-binding response OmpR family regulator